MQKTTQYTTVNIIQYTYLFHSYDGWSILTFRVTYEIFNSPKAFDEFYILLAPTSQMMFFFLSFFGFNKKMQKVKGQMSDTSALTGIC